jgi:regulator of replication initiation timing
MNQLIIPTINDFRSAQELSSSEPAQLRRTIAELEARIMEQDSLIAQQNGGIENLALRLKQRELELIDIKKMRDKPGQGTNNTPDDFNHDLEKTKLEKANQNMEALIQEFEEGFWTLFSEQRQGLEECLKALGQLPATPETKSLYAHVKKEWQAIEAAKKRNIITPVNALRQVADLERAVVTFILGRPRLSLTTVETWRAEVLQEAFVTDSKLKSLSTNDSIRIISTREEKKIYREQGLRAMRRAACMFPDKIKFEKKGKAARIIKIGEARGTNLAHRCIITVCYMIYLCNSLLQSFGELPEGSICTLGGIFRDTVAF